MGERSSPRAIRTCPFVWGYVLVAVGLFLWFWPVLTGNPISRTAWQARVWFRGWV